MSDTTIDKGHELRQAIFRLKAKFGSGPDADDLKLIVNSLLEAQAEVFAIHDGPQHERLRKSLLAIRENAKSQIDGMNSLGVPDDAPERRAATWYYEEAHHTLVGV